MYVCSYHYHRHIYPSPPFGASNIIDFYLKLLKLIYLIVLRSLHHCLSQTGKIWFNSVHPSLSLPMRADACYKRLLVTVYQPHTNTALWFYLISQLSIFSNKPNWNYFGWIKRRFFNFFLVDWSDRQPEAT